MAPIDHVVQLETAVWQALVSGDGSADHDLLSEEFLGVYPTGFAGRDDHVAGLADGPTVERFELSDIHTLQVADDAILLAYRAEYRRVRRSGMRDVVPEAMYVSSLWCRRGDRWSNVFSQDTPATGVDVV